MKRRRGSQPDNPDQSPQQPSVDAFFDRELNPDSIESLLNSMRTSRAQKQQFDDTQSMLDDLRSPVDAPDLSGKVLGELAERRGWLSTGQRRMVFAGRLATAACLLLVVTGLLLVRRDNPEAFQSTQVAGPVTEVVEATGAETTARFRSISEGLRSIESSCLPAVQMAATSVSSRESACGHPRTITASVRQDYSAPLSPGVSSWLTAGNVEIVVVVSNSAQRTTVSRSGQYHSINHWMIAPENGPRLPSYEATSISSPSVINVANWTAIADRGN